MFFDLNFKEAIDILINNIGWVQCEKFDCREYLSFDKEKNIFVINIVNDNIIEGEKIFDFCCDKTKDAYGSINSIPNEIKQQKYRFIPVFSTDSIKGIGVYSKGFNRNCYIAYRNMLSRNNILDLYSYIISMNKLR